MYKVIVLVLLCLFLPTPDAFSTLLCIALCQVRPIPVSCYIWAPWLMASSGFDQGEAAVGNWKGERMRYRLGYFFSAPTLCQHCVSGKGCVSPPHPPRLPQYCSTYGWPLPEFWVGFHQISGSHGLLSFCPLGRGSGNGFS